MPDTLCTASSKSPHGDPNVLDVDPRRSPSTRIAHRRDDSPPPRSSPENREAALDDRPGRTGGRSDPDLLEAETRRRKMCACTGMPATWSSSPSTRFKSSKCWSTCCACLRGPCAGQSTQCRQVTIAVTRPTTQASEVAVEDAKGRESPRRTWSACSRHFLPANPTGWGSDWQSAARSSKIMAAGCGSCPIPSKALLSFTLPLVGSSHVLITDEVSVVDDDEQVRESLAAR